MFQESDNPRPTPEHPYLVGFLIDVSGSMRESMYDRHGNTKNRLDAFRDSLEELVQEAKDAEAAPLVKIFAYGFGFGNLYNRVFGWDGLDVRDLLELSENRTTTISIDHLANNWTEYKAHIEDLKKKMFGETPMANGFTVVRDRLHTELTHGSYFGKPILFVVSDGVPTNSNQEEGLAPDELNRKIVNLAREIKDQSILIATCYVTSSDVGKPRHLYSSLQDDWPDGAKLMFECASPLPKGSTFENYLIEYNWTFENDGRLFIQINQPEILTEFMNLILSPLGKSVPSVQGSAIDEVSQEQRLNDGGMGRGVVIQGSSVDQLTVQLTERGDIVMSDEKSNKPMPKSAWANGSFFLVVFVVVIAGLSVLAGSVPFYTLALIIIGGILFVPLIGVLQLRQDEQLSEESFMALVKIIIKQLPLVGRFAKQGPQDQ